MRTVIWGGAERFPCAVSDLEVTMDDDATTPEGLMAPRNVLGGPLRECCRSPETGFFRNGRCDICAEDLGVHAVCAEVTEDFLEFSSATGNDLSTPRPDLGFPGLKPGDRWCICAARWLEAYEAGAAPPVIVNATHEAALQIIPLAALQEHATA